MFMYSMFNGRGHSNCNGSSYRQSSSLNCNGWAFSNCNGYSNNNNVQDIKPCENIEKIMKELNIKEKNFENDKKIREYLFNTCCKKHCTKSYYLRDFCIRILNEFKNRF